MNQGNQRWCQRLDSYRPASETIRTAEYEVAPIAEDVAKTFVVEHHYSGSYPSARFRYGLFHHGRLVGVAVYSTPCHSAVLTNVFPVHPKEAVELGRFVLLDEVPGNAETWMLGQTFRLLRQEEVADKDGRELRGILGVVSFSDPVPRHSADGKTILPGHVGTIYQAHNAAYIGRGSSRPLLLMPNGLTLHHRAVQKIRQQESGFAGCIRKLEEAGFDRLLDREGNPTGDPAQWLENAILPYLRRLRHRGNHKYAWALNRSMRKHLPASKAYPKHVDQGVA